MKSARIVIEGDNIRQIIALLRRKEEIHYQYDRKDVVILMEEEYYMRIKSNLMAVYILNFKDEKTVEIEIVVGGGSMNWDRTWGSEESENKKMARSILEICQKSSWKILEVTPADFKESLEQTATQQFMNFVFSWLKE